MSTDRFPAIDEYALLSDTHTAALVAPDGSVEWWCVPSFDQGSVFASILDRDSGGSLRLEVPGAGVPARRYLEDTMVLESRFDTGEGIVTVHDFLAVRDETTGDPLAAAGDPRPSGSPASPGARGGGDLLAAEHVLVRLIRADCPVTVRVTLDARPHYGRQSAQWQQSTRPGNTAPRDTAPEDTAPEDIERRWLHSGPRLWVDTELPLQLDGTMLRGEKRLAKGQALALTIGYAESDPRQVGVQEAERLLRRTRRVWQQWSTRSDYTGIAAAPVRRSALLLRALAFDETGALLAAPTTSLPEEIGGERNWDYRYTWYRDAALLLLALLRLGHVEEGSRYLRFLLHACAADPGAPPPMVGIDGKHDLAETALPHLSGYRESSPVRVGNEAYEQIQLDSYGHLVDAALAYQRVTGALHPGDWALLRRYVEQISQRWREPDHGIWEVRGPRRHYVNSKVMSWVCLDRGVQLAHSMGDREAPVDHWRRAADELREQVLRRGYSQERGSFVQAYDVPALDASLLRIPLVGFLPGDDPRVVSTVDRIRAELSLDGGPLLYRYHHAEVDDGLPGAEGGFLMCSFELVSALVLTGRVEQARADFDWLLARSGPLGLYSEQMLADGTALGNYPQALTHLGLIEAAVNLDDADSHEALHAWAAGRGSA